MITADNITGANRANMRLLFRIIRRAFFLHFQNQLLGCKGKNKISFTAVVVVVVVKRFLFVLFKRVFCQKMATTIIHPE